MDFGRRLDVNAWLIGKLVSYIVNLSINIAWTSYIQIKRYRLGRSDRVKRASIYQKVELWVKS